jgi:hypothetical protein
MTVVPEIPHTEMWFTIPMNAFPSVPCAGQLLLSNYLLNFCSLGSTIFPVQHHQHPFPLRHAYGSSMVY